MKNLFLSTQKKAPKALVIALLSINTAWAAGLVSPPIYVRGGPAGGTVACRVNQYGSLFSTPVAQMAIYANNSANPLPLSFNNCNKSVGLKQHEQCAFGAKITGNFSYTCLYVTGNEQGALFTGSIEILDSAGNVLAREAMHPI